MEKNERIVAFLMWILCVLMVLLGLVLIYWLAKLPVDIINDKSLIENTIPDKYNTNIVDSSYKPISKGFSGPYHAKNNTTNEIQDVYILLEDNNVSLYTKQNDNYVEVAH